MGRVLVFPFAGAGQSIDPDPFVAFVLFHSPRRQVLVTFALPVVLNLSCRSPPLCLSPSRPTLPPFEKKRQKKTLTHLNNPAPGPLPTLAHPYPYILQQRRVPQVRSVGVAVDVAGPFVLGCVRMAGADVARLQGFELLGCA